MIDPIAVGQTKDYILERDKKSKNPTTWITGAIDSMQKSQILSSMMDIAIDDKGVPSIKEKRATISNDFKIVKHGLKGWKNFGTLKFRTEKETLFNVEVDVIPDDLLKAIPLTDINELAIEIWGENQVDEELEKN